MIRPAIFGFLAAGWATAALRLRAALESEQRLRGENFRLQDQVDDLISDFVDMQRERDDAEGERDAERAKYERLAGAVVEYLRHPTLVGRRDAVLAALPPEARP